MLKDRVQEIMREKRITASDLAKESGLSRSMISKIISGDRGQKISHTTIYSIANALGTTPKHLTERNKDLATLREVINRCDNQIFKRRVDEVERLATGLFRIALPYFTPHEASHCEAVEKYLNQIIWGTEKEPVSLGENNFEPTPEEAMYLLSAAWLHDIGMMYGIFPGEKPSDLIGDTPRVMRLRDEHEMRTVRYIQDEWNLFPWPAYEKTLVSVVCKYHRRHHPINTFDPVQIISEYDGKPVRLVLLAALLRLADACDEDQSHAPGSLMELYKSLEMPTDAAAHWERAKLVRGIYFDHTNRAITLTGFCVPKFDFGLGEFDLREIIDIVREDIEEELRSVQQILLPYPNVYFGEVKSGIYRGARPELDQEEVYLSLWPYLLDKPRSGTEAAGGLAQMLLFAVKDGQKTGNLGTAWQDSTLFPIMSKTQELRPFDFMIRNLCHGVKAILSESPPEGKSTDRLIAYLESFLKEINVNCRKMAQHAQNVIEPEDVLIVHGYSTNVAKFLENVRPMYGNSLYIVDYHEPTGNVQVGPSENQKMTTFANKLDFDRVTFLHLAAVPQALNDLRRKNIACKVLMGTRGVLTSKDFLCKVGSYILVSTAKKFGAQVIAFADTKKFLVDGKSDDDVAACERFFLLKKMRKRDATMIETMCLTPTIDLVPKELVDLVVTEDGVFESDAVPIPAKDQASETSARIERQKGR